MADRFGKSNCKHCNQWCWTNEGDMFGLRYECDIGAWRKGRKCTKKRCKHYIRREKDNG